MVNEHKLLEVRGIRRRYGETEALKFSPDSKISFHEGEVHALVGENGAGKSTLVKIISGLETANAGSLSLSGVKYAPESAPDARERGVDIVLQESGLVQTMTVTDNLLLGREKTISRNPVYSPTTANRIDRKSVV